MLYKGPDILKHGQISNYAAEIIATLWTNEPSMLRTAY